LTTISQIEKVMYKHDVYWNSHVSKEYWRFVRTHDWDKSVSVNDLLNNQSNVSSVLWHWDKIWIASIVMNILKIHRWDYLDWSMAVDQRFVNIKLIVVNWTSVDRITKSPK